MNSRLCNTSTSNNTCDRLYSTGINIKNEYYIWISYILYDFKRYGALYNAEEKLKGPSKSRTFWRRYPFIIMNVRYEGSAVLSEIQFAVLPLALKLTLLFQHLQNGPYAISVKLFIWAFSGVQVPLAWSCEIICQPCLWKSITKLTPSPYQLVNSVTYTGKYLKGHTYFTLCKLHQN